MTNGFGNHYSNKVREMKVLVTGVGGQLGHDVIKELEKRNFDCIGVDRAEFDITNFEAAHKFITGYMPDAVIHCSAYTAVDKAEDEPELCHLVNAVGTVNIAKICNEIDAKMIYISTDYVFDGTKEGFYEVDDIPNPINVYGKTKLEGELAVQKILEKYFIVRISWVFGINGNNFVKTMLRLGKERSELNVVADQIGSPTYTGDLAPFLVDMVQTDKYGLYHTTNEGECTWAEFAEKIFKVAGMDVKVNYITTAEYPTKAKRPLNSKMSKESITSAYFKSLPHWKEALKDFVKKVVV